MITQERLKEILHYDPDKGVFTWLRSSRSVKAGAIAGCVSYYGYIVIAIKDGGVKRTYKAHRLAWLYVYGVWPANLIDHENQVKTDNRIVNLREATRSENEFNRPIQKRNTSGVKGVSWEPVRQRWIANISKGGKNVYQRRFIKLEDAEEAIREARRILHGEFSCDG